MHDLHFLLFDHGGFQYHITNLIQWFSIDNSRVIRKPHPKVGQEHSQGEKTTTPTLTWIIVDNNRRKISVDVATGYTNRSASPWFENNERRIWCRVKNFNLDNKDGHKTIRDARVENIGTGKQENPAVKTAGRTPNKRLRKACVCSWNWSHSDGANDEGIQLV